MSSSRRVSRADQAKMRRRSIGYVFQDFNLLPGLTALENVTLPLELDGTRAKAAREVGLEALEELGVADRADRFPDELSGGERQRVAIARAIVGERAVAARRRADRRARLRERRGGHAPAARGDAARRRWRRRDPRGAAGVVGRPRRLPARRPRRRPDGSLRPVPSRCWRRRSAMTTFAHRSELRGPANGGVAARRAVVRWAWRMFRREWRQQLLVVTLLTVAVAAAIGSITIAYNTVPADDGDFGSANQCSRSTAPIRGSSHAGLDSARKSFGTIDVIGHRSVTRPRQRRDGGLPITEPPTAPTAATSSPSVGAATRWPPARSPSPMGWRSLFGSRSGHAWRSTGTDERWWASSRTRAS